MPQRPSTPTIGFHLSLKNSDMSNTIDEVMRKAKKIERAPREVIDDAMTRLATLLE